MDKVSAKKVDDIIGNNTWTTVECDECLSRVKNAVSFSSSDGEKSVIICLDCLANVWIKIVESIIK